MLSLKRVQQSLQTLLGQVISEATILKYVMLLHLALEQWETAAIERLLTLPALHVDETSLRVDKKNQWIHVCSGGEITLKFLHEKRGQEAMQAIGVRAGRPAQAQENLRAPVREPAETLPQHLDPW